MDFFSLRVDGVITWQQPLVSSVFLFHFRIQKFTLAVLIFIPLDRTVTHSCSKGMTGSLFIHIPASREAESELMVDAQALL